MLAICQALFEHLNSSNIRYCHWKSNASLEQSLLGKTDLDVLIHKEDQSKFESSIKKYDLKKIISPPEKRYPGMEDYLGFDFETGGLIHLHVHYELVLGQKFIKNHHLPIEEVLFGNLIKKSNVYVPCPEMELLLLIIRAHMKVDIVSLIKHSIKGVIGNPLTPFPASIEKEFSYLIENSDTEKLKHLLVETQLPLPEEIILDFIHKFSENRLKSFEVIKTELKILSLLGPYRRNKSILVYTKYFYQFIRGLPLVNRMAKPKKKTLSHFGKVFSIIGADGSGKSTLLKDLNSWLSWKLIVNQYYYGIPKNVSCQVIDYVIRGLKKFRLNYFALLLESCFWVYVARARYAISEDSRKAIEKGVVVITDRFPFKGFYTMEEAMDGPRLGKYNSKQAGRLAGMESAYYEKINSPDRVFVLQVDFEELRKRKADLALLTHKKKADAVNAIKGGSNVVLIDANKPYSDVKLALQRLLWEVL